jgi:hypothetical protein
MGVWLEGMRKAMNVSIAVVLTDVRTCHLPNTSEKRVIDEE